MTILWGFFSVFPANAGMILTVANGWSEIPCVPRECGDDPILFFRNVTYDRCSPRMRG